jgi:tryptophan synthase beta subunit
MDTFGRVYWSEALEYLLSYLVGSVMGCHPFCSDLVKKYRHVSQAKRYQEPHY